MRISNPGGLLAVFAILSPVVLLFALYSHWWTIAAFFAPLALCHIGLLFQIRPAAYILVAAYIVGCIFILVSFFYGYPAWRLALKLGLNLMVIHELRLWLRHQTAPE